MTLQYGWQNIVLSVVILLAIGLMLYSIVQLFRFKSLQQENRNLTWLIILSFALIILFVCNLYICLSHTVEFSHLIYVGICLISALFVWFAARAGKVISIDLTKSAALEHYSATHDDLTGLPNLTYFNEQLGLVLKNAKEERYEVALLLIDLNRFKLINETLGYFVGDIMLQEVANRIRNSLRKTDLIARLGGDEFAVLINPVVAQGHIHTISKNITESIQEPLAVDGKPTDVGVSIGVALFPKHADNSLDLLDLARISMHDAEKQGDAISIYDPQTSIGSSEDIQIIGMLQRAIQDEQLKILYQPQVRLRDLKLISLEALIRWQHPNYGLLDPRHFIPFAESGGLIYEVNLWLLKNIVNLLSKWRSQNIFVPIAINITANGFLNREFQQEFSTNLKNDPWLCKYLKIELTETSSIDNLEEIMHAMIKYKKQGLVFSLDDYGTKHASLEYLKKLPFNELKIDQSFMFNATKDEDSRAIILHAQEIAKQLGLSAIAEGIESEEVLMLAQEYNIDAGQGYYFSSAIATEELEIHIKQYGFDARPFTNKRIST